MHGTCKDATSFVMRKEGGIVRVTVSIVATARPWTGRRGGGRGAGITHLPLFSLLMLCLSLGILGFVSAGLSRAGTREGQRRMFQCLPEGCEFDMVVGTPELSEAFICARLAPLLPFLFVRRLTLRSAS